MIHTITEGLVEAGHHVTLIAPCGSRSSAELHEVPGTPWGFDRVGPDTRGLVDRMHVLRHIRKELLRRAGTLDVVHYHSGSMAAALQPSLPVPSITTVHMALDTAPMRRLLEGWRAGPIVSVSDAQRRAVRDLDLPWMATVHNGLPLRETTTLGSGQGGYLAFLGRLSPEKDPASAMRAAIAANMPIRVAGPSPWYDQEYMRDVLSPLMAHPLVEWVGEIADPDKAAFLGNAAGLLSTTAGPEPFGLGIIEALARGTPVIARQAGAPPEIIRDGVHGFLVSSAGELEAACRALGRLRRRSCRAWALRRYSHRRMVRRYEALYESVLDDGAQRSTPVSRVG
jgi:glycosyltransferase involved in cell wall biosynthesis